MEILKAFETERERERRERNEQMARDYLSCASMILQQKVSPNRIFNYLLIERADKMINLCEIKYTPSSHTSMKKAVTSAPGGSPCCTLFSDIFDGRHIFYVFWVS